MAANVRIVGDVLHVDLIGAHRFLAFRRRIEVALAQVRSIREAGDAARDWVAGVKVVGARIPGIIKAGTFRSHGETSFWDVRDPNHAVVIELEGAKFARLVLEVQDVQKTVAEVNGAIQKG